MATKHWFAGLPTGIPVTGRDPGTQKYWFGGLPLPLLAEAGGPPPTPTGRRPRLLFSSF